MKHPFTLLAAMGLTPILSLPSAADPYTEIYRAAVERRMQETATSRKPVKPAAKADISAACQAWMVGTKTGETRYRDFVLDLYDRFLREKVDHDFHVSRPFGLVTLKLHHAGALTRERRNLARRQALERIAWFLDTRREQERFFDPELSTWNAQLSTCNLRDPVKG